MWWYRIQVQLFNKVEFGFSILHVDNYYGFFEDSYGASRPRSILVCRTGWRSSLIICKPLS